jgi:hypothetical protein
MVYRVEFFLVYNTGTTGIKVRLQTAGHSGFRSGFVTNTSGSVISAFGVSPNHEYGGDNSAREPGVFNGMTYVMATATGSSRIQIGTNSFVAGQELTILAGSWLRCEQISP